MTRPFSLDTMNALGDYTNASASLNSSTGSNSSSIASKTSPGTITSSHDVSLGVGLGILGNETGESTK